MSCCQNEKNNHKNKKDVDFIREYDSSDQENSISSEHHTDSLYSCLLCNSILTFDNSVYNRHDICSVCLSISHSSENEGIKINLDATISLQNLNTTPITGLLTNNSVLASLQHASNSSGTYSLPYIYHYNFKNLLMYFIINTIIIVF